MSSNNLLLSQNGKTPLEVATEAARKAGQILVDHFYSDKAVIHKGRGNLVTEVDALSEKYILDQLATEYPHYLVLSEETHSSTAVTDYTWIVDPLDGTNNYVFGIPHFCVNIALVNNDDILLGITYDPIRDELFYGEKGKGAFLNGTVLKVSQVKLLEDAAIGFDLGYSDVEGGNMLEVANNLWGQLHCLRVMGSAALGLAYVACGRISLYYHRFIYPWDIASGILLIREAGGEVVGWDGKQSGFRSEKLVASNKSLCKQFLEKSGLK